MTHLEAKIQKYKNREHAYKIAARMAEDNGHKRDAAEFRRISEKARRKVFRYERAEANEARMKA